MKIPLHIKLHTIGISVLAVLVGWTSIALLHRPHSSLIHTAVDSTHDPSRTTQSPLVFFAVTQSSR